MYLEPVFRVIRDVYNNNSQETAHRILEKDIEKFGSALNMTLYVDGPQALEKSGTAETREKAREKALSRVKHGLDIFESRLDAGTRDSGKVTSQTSGLDSLRASIGH